MILADSMSDLTTATDALPSSTKSSALPKASTTCVVWALRIVDYTVVRWAKVHVWLLLLGNCLFVGESLILWAAQCVWTGTPPGRHTTSGSLKVLWHKWHPFFVDTAIGFFVSFNWIRKKKKSVSEMWCSSENDFKYKGSLIELWYEL